MMNHQNFITIFSTHIKKVVIKKLSHQKNYEKLIGLGNAITISWNGQLKQ